MKPVAFGYVAASNPADASALLARAGDGAKLIAGGQSLGPMLNLRLARPGKLVDIARAATMREVKDEGDAVVYGAAITHAEIEDGIASDATPGWLAAVARHIAYRAVRNRGTIGGSLAHADPAADWVNVLTALGAAVMLGRANASRTVALTAFFTGPFARRGEVRGAGGDRISRGRAEGAIGFAARSGTGANSELALTMTYRLGGPFVQFGRPAIVETVVDHLLSEVATNLVQASRGSSVNSIDAIGGIGLAARTLFAVLRRFLGWPK